MTNCYLPTVFRLLLPTNYLPTTATYGVPNALHSNLQGQNWPAVKYFMYYQVTTFVQIKQKGKILPVMSLTDRNEQIYQLNSLEL